MKIIRTIDINKNIHDIPELVAGIHNRNKNSSDKYVSLSESNRQEFIPYSKNDIYDDISNSIKGNNFHEDLEALHKNVKPYIENEGQSNAHDNYIYDTLKKEGIPSGKTSLHVVSVATMPDLDPINSDYLKKKWIPLLDQWAKASGPKVTSLNNAEYSRDEIKKIPQSLKPTNARVLIHPSSNTEFEYHPTEGYRYLGHNPYSPSITSHALNDLVSHRAISNELHNTYKDTNDENGSIGEYTEDSAKFNRYLHLLHNGKISGQGKILGMPYNEIHSAVSDISNVINNAPHESHNNDFKVYSGLHAEFNPERDAKATDENGNYIFHNPAFTSTSLRKIKALDFAREKTDEDYPHKIHDVMSFTIPGGYPHGMFVKPFSEHDDEEEYLLDKGHTFIMNPHPKHYVYDGKIYREWSAKLHPKSAIDKPYDKQTNEEKINNSYLDNVSPEHIEKMSRDNDENVVAAAARNEKLPEDRFKMLSLNNSSKVRKALMMNPKLPDSIIDDKIKNMDLMSVRALVNRKNLKDYQKSDIIKLGFTDSEKFRDNIIHQRMALRNDLLDGHVRQLQQGDNTHVHSNLAGNPHINPDILHEYASHKLSPVRFSLAENHAIKPETLNLLRNDEHAHIRHAAKDNPLNHRNISNS